jgi:hypothetical protein
MWKRKPIQDVCDDYALRLENVLEAAEAGEQVSLDPDLQGHVANCGRCLAAFEDAGLGRTLLRWGIAPAPEPGFGFSTRVLATIRAEQQRRAPGGSIFWRPVELLAGRVALAAATVVMLLGFYVYAFVVPQARSAELGQEISALVPQPEIQPAPQTKDDVLVLLAEHDNGR